MPGRNGTGPHGQGPLTGRGLGNCKPFSISNIAGTIANWGQGFGFGRGRGMRNQFRAGYFANQSANVAVTTDNLLELKAQAGILESHLNNLKEQIQTLEGKQQG